MCIGDNSALKEAAENRHKITMNISKYQITINDRTRDQNTKQIKQDEIVVDYRKPRDVL